MSRSRSKSAAKIVLTGLALVLVLMATSAWWLLRSSSGAAWLWGQLEDAAAGSVRSSHVEGNLATGLIIQNLEYQSESARLFIRRVEVEAGPGWWPLSVQIPSLVLQDVDIVSLAPDQPVDGVIGDMDIQAMLEALNIGIPVKIHDASLSNITLQTGDEPPRTLVDSLRFSAGLDDKLAVDRLEVLATGIEANLNGQLGLVSPFELAVAGEGRVVADGGANTTAMIFPFRLDSTGNPDKIQFTLASTERGLELGTELLVLDISGSVSGNGMQLENTTLTGDGVNLAANGTLDWFPQVRAGLDLAIHQLDLSPWLADWPAGENMLGDIELDWSESGLKIPVAELSIDGTSIAVNIEADVDIHANSVNARVDWNNLGWPLADPNFFSPHGSLNASGSIDQWKAAGEMDIELGNYPGGRIEVEGGVTGLPPN